MKKTFLKLMSILMVLTMLAACTPGEPQVNPVPQDVKIHCANPVAGAVVKDVDFSMTGNKEGTGYSLEWIELTDGDGDGSVLSEDGRFMAAFSYSLNVTYEMEEGWSPEESLIELEGGTGIITGTEKAADGVRWVTSIGFGTTVADRMINVITGSPVVGVKAMAQGARVKDEWENNIDCIWKWITVDENGKTTAITDETPLPQSKGGYIMQVYFEMPQGFDMYTTKFNVSPDCLIKSVSQQRDGKVRVDVSYNGSYTGAKTEITLDKAQMGMTVADLAKNTSVKIDGSERDVYDLFVCFPDNSEFLDNSQVLMPGTYKARLNFEGIEGWGSYMFPDAIGLTITEGYTPEYVEYYAASNFGLWMTFTVKDEGSVKITMANVKPGDTINDILDSASVVIDGKRTEIYGLYWIGDNDYWYAEDEPIKSGSYIGRINFEGSENWCGYTGIDALNVTMSSGYTPTSMELYAMANYGIWFTFDVIDNPTLTPSHTIKPEKEEAAPEPKPQKEESVPEHKHSYSLISSVEPTCVKEGKKVWTCSCGDTYTETIPATGQHKFVWKSVDYISHQQYCPDCGAVGEKEDHDMYQDYSRGEWVCRKCDYTYQIIN